MSIALECGEQIGAGGGGGEQESEIETPGLGQNNGGVNQTRLK